MGRYQITAVMMALAIVLGCASTATAGDWESVGTTDGVTVYVQERPGSDDFAMRGEMTANVHIGKIIRVFTNPNERQHWIANYVDHESLDLSQSGETYWLELDPSRLTSSRDYVIQSQHTFDADSRTFTSEANSIEDSRKPEQDCCVRATTKTKYVFEAVEGREQVKLSVEVETDPGGRIPSRIVRSTMEDWPVTTLTNLVRRASIDAMPVDPRAEDWHE